MASLPLACATWARRGHAPTPPRTFSPGQTPTGWPPRTLPSATDPGVGRRSAGDWARSSADQSWVVKEFVVKPCCDEEERQRWKEEKQRRIEMGTARWYEMI